MHDPMGDFWTPMQHLPSDVDAPHFFEEIQPLHNEIMAAQQSSSTRDGAMDEMSLSVSQTQESSEVREEKTRDVSQEDKVSPEVTGLFANLPEGEELEKYLVAKIQAELSARSSASATPVSIVESMDEQTSDTSHIAVNAGSKPKSSVVSESSAPSKRFKREVSSSGQTAKAPSVDAEEAARLRYLGELMKIASASKRHGGNRKLTIQEVRDYVTDVEVRMYRDGFEDEIQGMRDWTDDELRFNVVYNQSIFTESFADRRPSNDKKKKNRDRENRRKRSK